MDPWIGQPSLSLDLNVGLTTAPKKAKVEEKNFLPVAKRDREQVEPMEAELRRVDEENARLSEMLRTVVAKYTELQGHVNDMMAAANRQLSTSAGGSAASPPRKRIRSDSLDTKLSPPLATAAGGFAVHDQMECTPAAAVATVAFHEPVRRIREVCKPKVTRRYVHADPSDLSLVSNEANTPDYPLPRDHIELNL
jgi:hypothetical protein